MKIILFDRDVKIEEAEEILNIIIKNKKEKVKYAHVNCIRGIIEI